ncbi:hypothetical protein KPATCC21470_6803 [Kitasatospora purpeofusca]
MTDGLRATVLVFCNRTVLRQLTPHQGPPDRSRLSINDGARPAPRHRFVGSHTRRPP